MRKINLLFLALFVSVFAFSQQKNSVDAVYLKNGSVIRGMIVEQVPGESVTIETADKNVFVLQMDEISRMTKETRPVGRRKTSNPLLDKRKSYIGISGSIAVPVGDFVNYSNVGFQLNLANFGYLFTKNIGITATWFGAVNPYIEDDYLELWSYGGLMGGPLFSFPVSERLDWDFMPMIGIASTTLPDTGYEIETASSVAFSAGTQLRLHLGRHFSLLFNAGYFSTTPVFSNFEQNIGTFSIGFGGAYRLK